MIHHGGRRAEDLRWPFVAIPTFQIAGRRRKRVYDLNVQDGTALRHRFKLNPYTGVLLVSVAPDKYLEDYWSQRKLWSIPQQLVALDPFGITVPNYSYFSDAPRTQTLFNRARMSVVSNELSAAGLGVIPHLNALTEADWKFWADLLSAQPQIHYIAKEFQTGLANKQRSWEQFDALCRLQERVGRSLHPIIVGGARFASRLDAHFADFTVVDSTPFLKTMKRRIYAQRQEDRRWRWRRLKTEKDEPLDHLLLTNIERCEAKTLHLPSRHSF